jgi:hypothetical protein
MAATSLSFAALLERRRMRLAEVRLDDFEREADWLLRPFASTWTEKGQAKKMMRITAVNNLSGLGDCGGINLPL